ncbi:hypothetical protein PhCBS80983_g02165 [Powellomyces hirtus]|uniref:Ferritin-like diiron domain-containing protein n=1 Tax=Powellomyces hirtus TaxID=109895 RepID=A0A507E788_9FUNG|nr:hypothetical protein PhCBS80983_g02165 [Powellomyces hirtus]
MLVKALASAFLLVASATTAVARPVSEITSVGKRAVVEAAEPPVAGEVAVTSAPKEAAPAVPASASPSVTVAASPAGSAVPDIEVLASIPAGGAAATPAPTPAPAPAGGATPPPPPGTMAGTPPAAPAPAGAPSSTDLFVLNYALTLEHLEAAFYKEALAKFDAAAFTAAGMDPAIRDQMLVVQSHEVTHVTTLTSVIESTFGPGNAVPPCEYNFGLDTVAGFVATAAALERTGVSAYTGAIKFIAADAIKTAGATIATIEGRHASLLNALNTQKVNNVVSNVNPIPAPFDTPLGFTPVFSIAAPLIKACPFALPVQPFPALTLSKSIGNFRDNIGLLFTATLTDQQLTTPGALHCATLFGLAQKRTPVTISTDPRSGGMLADCEIPIEAQGFQELMVFIVNADLDVTIDNDKHVIAGPTTFQVLEKALVKVATS